jgi:hypothetical protein
MNASNDNTAARGLRAWWLTPPRSGMQRIIHPWEYRHLRGFASLHIGSGIVAAGIGLFVLARAGNAWAIFGAALLAVAAVHVSFALWELSIARSASARV